MKQIFRTWIVELFISFFLAALAIALAVLLSVVCAASFAHAEPWEFGIKNDFVIPGGLDRFLSNAFHVKEGGITLANEMYTPRDKRSAEIDTGDRPWDGYSYIQFEDIRRLARGQEFIIRSRYGLVGHDSGSEDLQKFVHNDLGAGVDPSWSGQNPSETTFELILSKRTREYIQSVIGDTALTQEYGARLGTVNDSLFLDQEIRKHFFRHLYFYAGLRGEAVGYNTHLDGRLFQDNLYTVDREWFVASGRLGVELYFPRFHHAFINYGYSYVTEEFEGQEGRHSYGMLTFGQKF